MSETRAVVFIEPKLFEPAQTEVYSFNGFECPTCNGSGNIYESMDYLGKAPSEFEPCQRCCGTGVLNAKITIEWNGR